MLSSRTLSAVLLGLAMVANAAGGIAEERHCWREGYRIVCDHHDNQEWREWKQRHNWRREHRWCHDHPERC